GRAAPPRRRARRSPAATLPAPARGLRRRLPHAPRAARLGAAGARIAAAHRGAVRVPPAAPRRLGARGTSIVMRVAIVGASGFVGATLLERLLGRGVELRALIHSSGGAWRLSRHGMPLHAFDLLSPDETTRALDGCTHVVNCSRGSRALMFEGLQNLLDACLRLRIERFIHVSSVAVYGDPPPP